MRCLRCYRRRKRARSISVTITADTGAFMASMSAASEFLAIARYCFGAYLGGRSAWPPREVQDAAKFRRTMRARLADELDPARNLPPHAPHTASLTPEQPPADHGDGSGAGGRSGGERA